MHHSINLMTPKARLHECCRDQVYLWLRIWIGILVLLTAVAVLLQLLERSSKRQLEQLELKYEPVAALKNANQAISNQIKQIRNEQEFVLKLSEQKSVIALLGLIGQVQSEEADEIFLQKLEVSQSSDMERTPDQAHGLLELSGMAREKNAIGRFLERLAQESPFQNLEVVNQIERSQKHMRIHQFDVKGTFE